MFARSNVTLSEDGFRARGSRPARDVLTLVNIGGMESVRKGQDFLIRVVQECRLRGLPCQLILVGDGGRVEQLRGLASELGVAQFIEFAGHVSDPATMRALLDGSDIYVSGARSEGLPRATLEAMARSLPVVSTSAGGERELLDSAWLTDVDDLAGFVARLDRLMSFRDPANTGRERQLSNCPPCGRSGGPRPVRALSVSTETGAQGIMKPDRPYVAIVGPFKFPWGEAASQRIRGMSASILGAGYDVCVLSAGPKPGRLELLPSSGSARFMHMGMAELPSLESGLWSKTSAWLYRMGRETARWLESAPVKPSHVIVYGGGGSYLWHVGRLVEKRRDPAAPRHRGVVRPSEQCEVAGSVPNRSWSCWLGVSCNVRQMV